MTFSIFIQKSNIGKDNKYPVCIRICHNRVNKYIRTIYRVPKSSLTKEFQLKDPYVLNNCLQIIEGYEEQIKRAGAKVEHWSSGDIKDFLAKKEVGDISFVEFSRSYLRKLGVGRIGTAKNIKTTINSVLAFCGRKDLLFKDITVKFLKEYEEWLLSSGVKGRGVSLYMGHIRHLFNLARDEYNDEDKGTVLIPYPFRKYKVPKQPITRKRALSKEQILSIYNYTPVGERDCLARDIFLLSFFLVGMNSVDLYECPVINSGRITYFRAKTKDRREDNAEISIKVEPEALKVIKKYAGSGRLLNLSDRYSIVNNLNAALNKGLKTIGTAIGLEQLTFYAARHSWATIAVNDCGIPKSDVHEALNHADPSMRVTDIYIQKDWGRIDKANRKVIDYIFV